MTQAAEAKTISDTLNTRTLEMCFATILFGFGCAVAAPDDIFAAPNFYFLHGTLPEWLFGPICIGAGAARWVALIFNGTVHRTPLIRMVGCCIGFAVWLGVSVSLALNTLVTLDPTVTTGLSVYPALAAFEVLAAAVCGVDAWRYDSLGFRTRAWEALRAERDERVG